MDKAKQTIPEAFKWLNRTQAVGAMMDNLFKMIAVIYVSKVLGFTLSQTLAVATILFVVPFVFCSTLAGALTDRFSKSALIRALKWGELAILLLAYPALLSHSAWPVFTVLTLLTIQSALFGPVKRGIVPEIVPEADVSEANGRMAASTYLGIILGLALPSLLLGKLGVSFTAVITGAVAVSLYGLFCAYRIPTTPAVARPIRISWRVFSDTWRAIAATAPKPMLRKAVWGSVAFSVFAALFQQVLVLYVKDYAGYTVEEAGFAFLFAAAGIMAGSFLCGRWSRRRTEFGCIPAGGVVMAVALLALAATTTRWLVDAELVLLGIGGGLFLVPVSAYLQTESEASRRGELLGAVECASFTGMILSACLVLLGSDGLHLSSRILLLLTAGFAALVAGVALMTLPEHAARFFVSRLVRTLYAVRVEGLENIPEQGGALLAMNHTAFSDAPLALSLTSRAMRFVMSREIYNTWAWCRPFFKLNRAIQIHSTDSAKELIASINNARKAIKEGNLLAICPEGELTHTGRIETFKKGFEKMVKGTGAPIIPVYIGNLWGSIFSFAHGEPGLHFPRHLFRRPVVIRIGRPMPTASTAEEVRDAVLQLSFAR
ncbi:MAG: MFS transporter [Kiritimatiellae bacterium]|nr:MFS transporter [Kiritimatiellia bacterium]